MYIYVYICSNICIYIYSPLRAAYRVAKTHRMP